MVDEILSNNQGDSTPVVSEPTTMAEAATQADTAIQLELEQQKGTNAKTAETEVAPQQEAKPEFSDPNMQKKFTQRMQELSEREKTYQAGEQKARAYEELLKNQDVVNYLRKVYLGQEEKVKEELSDDDFLSVTSDKKKFNEFLKNNVSQMLAEHTKPLQEQVMQMRGKLQEAQTIQDITDFADAKDATGNAMHPDFDELNEAGKIQPYLAKFAGSKLPDLEKIEMAYKLAKAENITQEVTKKAHNIVQQKKQAIGEKGNSAQSNLTNKKAMTMQEFAEMKAKEFGIEIP